MNFLKLTPEACRRMWMRVRFDSMKKHGKSIHYQISMKWMRKLKARA